MARVSMKSQIEALRTENEQLRGLWRDEIQLREAWEADAKRARRALVQRSHAAPSPGGEGVGALARAYCAANGVKSCTREQALSMAGGA